ncbi:MAG: hypothetical protein G01um101433_71 [Parcubacteria group bacterium Gr01-1014_33]|nr:MAG: hypothetical protein G01um101433_71 [Parcubacteria group bacterium Gr01-1014_33]
MKMIIISCIQQPHSPHRRKERCGEFIPHLSRILRSRLSGMNPHTKTFGVGVNGFRAILPAGSNTLQEGVGFTGRLWKEVE